MTHGHTLGWGGALFVYVPVGVMVGQCQCTRSGLHGLASLCTGVMHRECSVLQVIVDAVSNIAGLSGRNPSPLGCTGDISARSRDQGRLNDALGVIRDAGSGESNMVRVPPSIRGGIRVL